MKKFKVTVNGTAYEIELEEIEATAKAAPAKEKNAAPAPAAPAAPAPEGAQRVTAPMPGNILDVRVKVGDAVKKGDVLLILEAMKMENEIMAAADGKITSVNVNKGDSVETGAVLCTIG